MEFRILGTGSATPLANRNPSGFIIGIDNFLILLDCGEGTQSRLIQYKVKTSRIKYVFISHLHGDHYFGLIGLISSFSLNGRTEPLIVFGPRGLDEIITLQLKYSKSILNYDLKFVATNPDKPELLFDDQSFFVNTFPLNHRVATTGFLISTKEAKRKILRDKLPLNFPSKYFSELQLGNDVKDDLSGILYKNIDYTASGGIAKKIAYCSDTIYDETRVPFIENADLLYHEATFSQEMEQRAAETFHSTAAQAAQIAKLANAKKLIIGHFSSRYKTLNHLLEEAQAVFTETHLAVEGENYII